MKNRQYPIVLFISLLLFVSCAAPTPTPVPPTPTITPSPAPTNTPTPTPTPTPIPPLALTFNWPESVPALPPVPVAVELIPPPGITPQVDVYAKVVDPEGTTYQEFTLTNSGSNRYIANPGLQLPLFPKEGDWRITLQIETPLDVEGKREVYFQATPPRFHSLTGTLPSEITVQIP
ncbi:MAG: hypothetical protein JW981_02165, partial [Anaerolineae bacterium]|nr:hypothetical protein [Anaerolineae bacterium]